MAPFPPKIRRLLDGQYERLRPTRVELVGDYVGKELFAVHGESLILHCDGPEGFQVLHAVHAVETFLQRLKERGCNFHVVWFQDLKQLCIPGDCLHDDRQQRYLLLRTVIIHHLKRVPDVSFEFTSLTDSAYNQYLTKYPTHLILGLDPKAYGDEISDFVEPQLSFVYALWAKGFSFAFINGLTFVSSNVKCSVVSATTGFETLDQTTRWETLTLMRCKSAVEPSTFTYTASLQNSVADAIQDWTPWEDQENLTSREVTAVHAICQMAVNFQGDAKLFNRFAIAYITHLALLRRLPLSHRSLKPSTRDAKVPFEPTILSDFMSMLAEVICKVTSMAVWDSFDLMDGRMLALLVDNLDEKSVPQSLLSEVRRFTDMIHAITKVDLSPSLPRDQPEQAGADLIGSVQEDPNLSILPFSHPTLDKYLEDVHVVANAALTEENLPKIFRELSHWHNARKSVDYKQPPRPKLAWQRRKDQKWMASYIKYSASLVNASGKMIDPEIIVVDSAKPSKEIKHGPSKLQEALRQKKESAKSESALKVWNQQMPAFEKEEDLVKRYLKVTKYVEGLSSAARAAVRVSSMVYCCDILASLLDKTGRDNIAGKSIMALMWSTLQSLSQQDPSLAVFVSNASIYPASVHFQLRNCGPFLERSFDPAPDPRVPFHPDAWQRQVLDAIDADKSLFVVAPTSSGKTFISFYAMKKVLKTNDTDILVYVAPTKALVNQIAAEIQARFSKTYAHATGKSVWAIHTRDYRVNSPSGCQILITVPHILQIMLMAPSNAKNANSWSRRIRRIIFDEVHCIGQADDGIIWEQLLLLAPCPIIALSATVGNPMAFKNWLEGSERAKGHEFEMIVHSTRYSDLRKFIWKSHKPFTFTGLQAVNKLPVPGLYNNKGTGGIFTYIHPVASLVNRTRETISDVSLEPRECISLWETMAKHETEDYPLPRFLKPQKAFPKIVRRADVAAYETKLKETLQVWMADRKSPFQAVQRGLQGIPDLTTQISDSQQEAASKDGALELQEDVAQAPLPDSSEPGAKRFYRNIIRIVTDLHTQGALPAIFFNYDRVICEDLALRLLSDLQKAEQSWKASSSEWQKKMAKFNQWEKDSARIQAAAEKASKAKAKAKKNKDDDNIDERGADDTSAFWKSFDPRDPLPRFSLADTTKLSKSELEAEIWGMRFKDINPKIIQALRRGIGVHHAGMNRMYRQVVEMLFRKGFLTVVIATGTLALGINMPCKTVVFYGDSVFLTSLNYHQCAGRAGRRGFDLLGNVVFAGMPTTRAYDIMSARLPDLRGHFPLSTTLILRTLGLLHHTKNSDYAVRAVESLLSQTRLYLGGPSNQFAIKHQLRFSIEYLRRQHLLDQDGSPLNFAGLVGHLYFTENAVFAFHSLLKEGYFHALCKEFQRSRQATLLKLALVLSHLFCRFPVGHISDTRREQIRNSPSVVILPDLPSDALAILRQHNRETLDIFKNYTASFVNQHLADDTDRRLPFTGCDAGAYNDGAAPDASVMQMLEEHMAPPTKLRSPFVALSGFGDDSFETIHELCDTVRSGVFLEESAIPYLPIYPDDTNGQAWNAYIYDFYKHGDLTALVRDNLAKRGDVWFQLKDFSLTLATIVTSLTNFMDLDSAGDGDLAMMDIQDFEDEAAEQAELEEDDAAGGVEAATAPASDLLLKKPSQARGVTKKKPKVLENWDDTDSDDDEDDDDDDARSSTGSGFAVGDNPAWAGDGEQMLPKVLQMFVALQLEFKTKFEKIFA